jgi:hypothetical protein
VGWEHWAERAAIMEVDGGLGQDDAEQQAFALVQEEDRQLYIKEDHSGQHHYVTG